MIINESYKPTTVNTSLITHLFHYQSCRINKFKNFCKNKEIYFSNPSGFNDPWDCNPYYNLDSALEDPNKYTAFVDYFYRIGKRLSPQLPESTHQERKGRMLQDRNFLKSMISDLAFSYASEAKVRYGVYCLSPKSDSVLMWSHYANNHRGVCLGFRTNNNLFCSAIKVNYPELFPPTIYFRIIF